MAGGRQPPEGLAAGLAREQASPSRVLATPELVRELAPGLPWAPQAPAGPAARPGGVPAPAADPALAHQAAPPRPPAALEAHPSHAAWSLEQLRQLVKFVDHAREARLACLSAGGSPRRGSLPASDDAEPGGSTVGQGLEPSHGLSDGTACQTSRPGEPSSKRSAFQRSSADDGASVSPLHPPPDGATGPYSDSGRKQGLPDLGQRPSAQPDQPVDSKTPVQGLAAADVRTSVRWAVASQVRAPLVAVSLYGLHDSLACFVDLTAEQARALGNELFAAARLVDGGELRDVQAGAEVPR